MPDLRTIPDLPQAAAHFRLIREETQRLASGLSDGQFNWKPAPDRWSIGQCLEHLLRTHTEMVGRLEDAVGQAQRRGGTPRPVKVGFFGRLFVKLNGPVPNRPMKTVAPLVPSASDLGRHTVLSQFDGLQERLIRLAESAAALDLNRVKVSSPNAKVLRFNVPAWIITTAAHEQRHLLQAQRVRAEPGFPAE